MCTTPAIPRFRLAGASSRRKRARLKRVNIHWPIPTKIGHFDFYSIVVALGSSSAKFMDNNRRKISRSRNTLPEVQGRHACLHPTP